MKTNANGSRDENVTLADADYLMQRGRELHDRAIADSIQRLGQWLGGFLRRQSQRRRPVGFTLRTKRAG